MRNSCEYACKEIVIRVKKNPILISSFSPSFFHFLLNFPYFPFICTMVAIVEIFC